MSNRRASGLRAWVIQRVTAVYLAVYTLFLTGLLLFNPPSSHEAWKAWTDSPFTTAPLLLYCLAILLHAWVGIRDVLIDYVPLFIVRVVLLTLFGLGLIGSGLWLIKVVFLAGRII